MDANSERVAVMGLGYVGLPLAVAFGRLLPTTGFDINRDRVEELKRGRDRNEDVAPGDLADSPRLSFTSEPKGLLEADVFIVSVPTPVDKVKRPDLSYLRSASAIVGQALLERRAAGGAGTALPVVVYESTVYPGCTEEVCVPALEAASGLRCGVDFKVGYSPERINPGDREHTLPTIVKVVAGQDPETTKRLARLYALVVKAGVHEAEDIRTAEAAKVIENTQRDLNIALMNELAILFHRLGIDTREVLRAARTKWNFLPFEPGLVGGHCIPEDPYYLTHKAEEVGYHPDVILAGRRINDQMGAYVAQETVKLLIRSRESVRDARILVLGASFKENVSDVRNTRVVDLVRTLREYCPRVEVHDPVVGAADVRRLGLDPANVPLAAGGTYDAVVLAVAHEEFRKLREEDLLALLDRSRGPGVLVDVKAIAPDGIRSRSDVLYWRL